MSQANSAGGTTFFSLSDMMIFILLLAIGMAIRVWIAAQPGLGHTSDLSLFMQWTRALHVNTLTEYYEKVAFCDYPPAMILVLKGVGWVAAQMGDTQLTTDKLTLWLKAPAILADFVLALVLFFHATRVLPGRGSLAASLWFLNPLVIYNSAYWGQYDSVFCCVLAMALVVLARNWWGAAGGLSVAAMLLKFQSIAVLPLIMFETYRLGRWRGVAWFAVCGAVMFGAMLSPFVMAGKFNEVLQRSYVNVVGQYPSLSHSAFNVWHLVGEPKANDQDIPHRIAWYVSQGQPVIEDDSSWLLKLRWRTLSLMAFSLVVALLLTLYSYRTTLRNRWGVAGLLVLAFYLFPTEMHERYAIPAVGFLALWAVGDIRRERIFWLLSALILLNVVVYLSPKDVSFAIAAANVLIFVMMMAWLLTARMRQVVVDMRDPELPTPGDKTPVLIRLFRIGTVAMWLLALGGGVASGVVLMNAPTEVHEPNTLYLSDLTPISKTQSWGKVMMDRSATGGLLRLGDAIYLRGIGTHAKAKLEYKIPPEAVRFETRMGIDDGACEDGSAMVEILIDDKRVYKSELMKATMEPINLSLPINGSKLTISVQQAENGNRCDHVSFGLARFVMTSDMDNPATDASTTIPQK